MRRSLKLVVPIAALALALPAFAGGPECAKAAKIAEAGAKSEKMAASGKHCSYSKEECQKAMAQAKNNGWLGVMLDKDESGTLTIKEVVDGSPAEKAGFRAGDVFHAVNGVTYTDENKDRLTTLRAELKPGKTATYTVVRDGVKKDLTAKLATMPDAVYNAWVGEHMKEHTAVASN